MMRTMTFSPLRPFLSPFLNAFLVRFPVRFLVRFLGAFFAALAVCTASASAHTLDRERGAIEALEQRWLTHLTDPAALNAILADDFRHPVAGGITLNKAQQIAWARRQRASSPRQAHFEELNVRLYGGTAIAHGVVAARDARGRPKRTRFTDVFVFRRGRWQAVRAEERPVQEIPA
jgi:hypothetical protein